MFEITFFDMWVKHHLWNLLLQPHWFINHFQCGIIRAGSLELIYIRWLWTAQSKSYLAILKNLPFYIFRIGRAADVKKFCDCSLIFHRIQLLIRKTVIQYFSGNFLNQIYFNYISYVFMRYFWKPVFIIYQTVHPFIS